MSDKIISLLCGIIFGIGLVISGMTNPEKVIGFLSVTRNWDASLIFVMGGAIIITAPFFYLLKNKKNSYLGFEVIIPKKNGIDIKLVIGALLFGIGWGLSGLCPGPSVSAISVFDPIIIFFLFSMIVGILFNKFF